jgi:membrane-bound metal-dependent hydrolase YbcI (DUF457 family)
MGKMNWCTEKRCVSSDLCLEMRIIFYNILGWVHTASTRIEVHLPFTPFHVGPAVAVKAVFEKKFSLLVFTWAQVVIDLQPLLAVLTGRGEHHGITHTIIGAAVLGGLAAVTAKYPVDWVLSLRNRPKVTLSWKTVLISAWVGTFSHILLDALIYSDMVPFWPLMESNPFLIGISHFAMICFCVVSCVIGAAFWGVRWLMRRLWEG